MGKRKLKTVFWVFLLLIVTGLIGCKQKEPEKEQLCHIVMEKGDGYQVTDPVRTIKSGSNVSFTVTLDNNWQILGTDYHGETEIIKDDDGKTVEIVLHEVKYSESTPEFIWNDHRSQCRYRMHPKWHYNSLRWRNLRSIKL